MTRPDPAPQDAATLRHALANAPAPDQTARDAAIARDATLTKPPGALGRLEELAIWYAGWRGTRDPAAATTLTTPQIVVFAGNHGVTAQGISAFPAEVTAQMVENFATGGAAINQLSAWAGATMSVHPIALDQPTRDFTTGPALDAAGFAEALRIGWNAVDPGADLLVTGEMGIGNTTAAAAIAHALFGGEAADWTGRGTGLDPDGVAQKTRVVAAGLAANPDAANDPLTALAALGGREIVAMAAAIARARVLGMPVILDGFIATAAAATLAQAVPGALDHAVAGHVSAEAAHAALLKELGLRPILSLDMRLGEGSGAAVAIQILRAALACHNGMASFAEAGVSEG